ncbi:MAG: methyltransferase, TIGR04325 family [Rhodocyclaceae bacterium]|nr:methyltransferase, TIGR04325 family [Rhodocyclaceae bacterium]
MNSPLWTGIFASFEEVPSSVNAYDGVEWQRAITARIERWHSAVGQALPLPPVPERGTLLAALIAGMGSSHCSVLDIGGGGATTLLQVKASLPEVSLDWTVVEREAVCAAASSVVLEPGLQFTSKIPTESPADIVYMGSSLQYFEDWRGVFDSAIHAAKRFVLLEDVPAVSCASFASAQRYYSGSIPTWFISHDELMSQANRSGLKCVLRDRFRASILGDWNGYPMDNFPETHRVGLASTFLFKVGV